MNATLLDGVDVIRSMDIVETKYLVVQLANKCQVNSQPPTRGLASKRKKDCEVEVIWVRQLSTIPTISENIATTLMNHFGTMASL